VFTFKDGGETLIDFKIKENEDEDERDILFVFSG
jgi:hypothetical protein